MAIFGFGAIHGNRDVLNEFLAMGIACVGWSEAQAPPLYALLRAIKAGDLVYVKSFNPTVGLTINAVGVVTRAEVKDFGRTGHGVPVRWAWHGQRCLGKPEDKYPVRAGTIYEEFHPAVHAAIIDLLLSREPVAASPVIRPVVAQVASEDTLRNE